MKRKRSSPYVRTSRKKKKSRRSSARYSITTLVPKTKMVSLKYCGTATLDSSSVSGSTLHIRCNDMFDPEAATGGHQPLGFDQWMIFYNHFEVLKSKISFHVQTRASTSVSSTTLDGTYATLRIDSDLNSLTTDILTDMERAGTTVKYIKPSNGGGAARISKTWSQASIFGKHQRGNA